MCVTVPTSCELPWLVCLPQTMSNSPGNSFHFTFTQYPESDNLSQIYCYCQVILSTCSPGAFFALDPHSPLLPAPVAMPSTTTHEYTYIPSLGPSLSLHNGWPDTQFEPLTWRAFLPPTFESFPEEDCRTGDAHIKLTQLGGTFGLFASPSAIHKVLSHGTAVSWRKGAGVAVAAHKGF